jgi:glyoxylase-like metal-dependent hydrolase (beta-lactamase superfamily II)
MQILKNLYQVSGDLNGVTWNGVDAGYNDCNSYVLATPEGLIMFDCGCGETLEQIYMNMRYWDLDPAAIHYCFLTHPHFDHAGAGHLLKNQGTKMIAVFQTADAVARGDERCCPYLYHKRFQPFVIDRVVSDGEKLEILGVSIEVMHLPGHSMGCTAYLFNHEGKKMVVSGDVIGTLLVGEFGWSGSIDFNRDVYLQSLKRFAKVESDIMLPGHGLIYFHQPKRRVEEALNIALIEWRS